MGTINSQILYKCTAFYAAQSADVIRYSIVPRAE